MAHFKVIEEVLNYQKNLLANAPSLATFNHIGLADDELIFEYPAMILTGEPVTTVVHATHKFQNNFRVGIFIYHAAMTVDRSVRTLEDLELVSAVRAVLHSDLTMGGGVIFGHVDSIAPGTIRRPGNVFAIGSRLSWFGQGQESF